MNNINELLFLVNEKISNECITFAKGYDVRSAEYNNKLNEFKIFLLENIKKLNININISIEYEKLAELICKIEDIFEEEYFYNKDVDLPIYPDFFKNEKINTLLTSHNGYESTYNYIKNINKTKLGYEVDAFNVVRDKNTNIEMTVHATSRVDTENGQGKQFFYSKNHNEKNIYILNSLINKKHNGKLVSQKHRIYNLLPFLSMISKICFLSSKISTNENLIYFMKTPVIILGDDIWENYNSNIANIFTQEEITLSEWFYSTSYKLKNNSDIQNEIFIFFENTLIFMIDNLNKNQIENSLQENERILLQQLYDFSKAVIFLSQEYDREISKIASIKINLFFEIIENYNNNYGGLKIKNNIEYNNYLKIDFINTIYIKPKILYDRNDIDITNIYNLCVMKNNNVFEKQLNFYSKNNINSIDVFLNDVIKSFKFKKVSFDFSEKIDWDKLLDLYELFFNDIYFGQEKESLDKVFNITQLFRFLIVTNYPTSFQKIYKNKNIFDKEASFEKFIYIFAMAIKVLSNKEGKKMFLKLLFDQMKLQKACFPDSYFEMINNENNNDWKILVLSTLFFPKTLNWNEKESFELKKTIFKYTNFIFLKSDIEKHILFVKYSKISFFLQDEYVKDNIKKILSDDETFFRYIVKNFKEEKYIPEEFANLIISSSGNYIAMKFIKYLSESKICYTLKDALSWKMSSNAVSIENFFY